MAKKKRSAPKTLKIAAGAALTVTMAASNSGIPPVSVQWLPPAGATDLTVTLSTPAGDEEDHTFHVHAGAAGPPGPPGPSKKATPAFSDRLLQFSDGGGGVLLVQNGPEQFQLDAGRIDQIVAGQLDVSQFLEFTVAARASLAGYATVRDPDGSINPAALAMLNGVSFKAY